MAISTSANVQAYSESHAADTQMGPFTYSEVKYYLSPTTLVYMDAVPNADSPFSVYYWGSDYYHYITQGGNFEDE